MVGRKFGASLQLFVVHPVAVLDSWFATQPVCHSEVNDTGEARGEIENSNVTSGIEF